MPASVFSFFSGVGMLDLGFQEAGFNIVLINEYKQEFLNSYIYARRDRYPYEPRFGYHLGDINMFLKGQEQINMHQYIDELRNENEVIGFIGGPPCPDFSVGGLNRGRYGVNGRLAQSFIDMIIEYRPDFFLFENVKGLVRTQRHRVYFNELKEQLNDSDYCLSDELLNSLSFGVPQDRDRVIMLGVNRQSILANDIIHNNKEFQFPWLDNLPYNSEIVKQLPWPTRSQFIENGDMEFNLNVPRALTVEYWFEQNDVEHHPNGNDVFAVRGGLPKILAIDEGDTSRKSFKRLHRYRYSPTAAYGNNEIHLHPYKVRRLSVAETMAIQSLPGWFELPPDVSLSAKFKMVGNGVPYLMALEIANKIKEYFNL